jgi:hypothetical protein
MSPAVYSRNKLGDSEHQAELDHERPVYRAQWLLAYSKTWGQTWGFFEKLKVLFFMGTMGLF